MGSWALTAAFPWLLGKAIDAGFTSERGSDFVWWCVAMFVVSILVFPVLALRHHTVMETRLSTVHWLRTGISQKVIAAGNTKREELPAGEVMTAASSDTEALGELSMNSVQVLGWLSGLGVAFVLTAQASWSIAALLVVGVVLSTFATGPLARSFRKRQGQQRKNLAALTNHTTDGLTGLRVLRGVGGQTQFLDAYHAKSVRSRDSNRLAGNALAAVMSISSLTPGVLTLVLVLWAVIDVRSGALQPGDVVMIAGATRFLYMPVTQLGMFPATVAKASVAAGRLNKLFSVETPTDPPGARTDPIPDGVLTDPVTGFTAAPGRFTAISSDDPFHATRVAQRLARLDASATAGHVDGQPLNEWTIATVRETIIVNDTHPMLLSGTLRSQLDPPGHHTDDELRAALHVAAADDVLSLLPDGLDDYVTERGRSLSGGQRQRVALARVVLRDPQVLILVEPTSAVDAYTESLVAERLAAARRGKTTIVVTSSPMLLSVADTSTSVEATA